MCVCICTYTQTELSLEKRWTKVSWTIGEHSTHLANEPVHDICFEKKKKKKKSKRKYFCFVFKIFWDIESES